MLQSMNQNMPVAIQNEDRVQNASSPLHGYRVGREHQHPISPNSVILAFSTLGVGSFAKQARSHDGTYFMAEFYASSCRAVYKTISWKRNPLLHCT